MLKKNHKAMAVFWIKGPLPPLTEILRVAFWVAATIAISISVRMVLHSQVLCTYFTEACTLCGSRERTPCCSVLHYKSLVTHRRMKAFKGPLLGLRCSGDHTGEELQSHPFSFSHVLLWDEFWQSGQTETGVCYSTRTKRETLKYPKHGPHKQSWAKL